MASPKERFIKSPLAKVHADLASQPVLEQFFDVAMLQLLYNLGTTAGDSAAANYMQIAGAEKLRAIFMTLSIRETLPTRNPRENLTPT